METEKSDTHLSSSKRYHCRIDEDLGQTSNGIKKYKYLITKSCITDIMSIVYLAFMTDDTKKIVFIEDLRPNVAACPRLVIWSYNLTKFQLTKRLEEMD
jgi:hypothetical protein